MFKLFTRSPYTRRDVLMCQSLLYQFQHRSEQEKNWAGYYFLRNTICKRLKLV